MSSTRRAYGILRSYIGREWERIQGVERDLAEAELRDAMSAPGTRSGMSEEFEVKTVHTNDMSPEERQATARRLLGVEPNSPFEDVRKAFDRLNRRADPGRFPAGSAEQKQAAEIRRRVHWAYQVLTEGIDTTEKRFKSLEL